MEVIIVTAPRNSGKTTYLKKFCLSHNCIGYIAESDEQKNLFYYEEFRSKKTFPSLTTEVHEDWSRIGKYYFKSEVFIELESFLDHLINESYDYIVLDEIGKLELEGKGFDVILNKCIRQESNLVLVVRDIFVDDVIEKYKLQNAKVINVSFR